MTESLRNRILRVSKGAYDFNGVCSHDSQNVAVVLCDTKNGALIKCLMPINAEINDKSVETLINLAKVRG